MERGELNKRVVVVDDDPTVQEVARAYLERDGYLVCVAGSAAEGLAVSERVRPGLIVVDLMLPDRRGEDVAKEIRARSDVPIVMLTAKAPEDERVGGLALGADGSRPRARAGDAAASGAVEIAAELVAPWRRLGQLQRKGRASSPRRRPSATPTFPGPSPAPSPCRSAATTTPCG